MIETKMYEIKAKRLQKPMFYNMTKKMMRMNETK